ncbi:MAG: hypothetical protein PUK67_04635 [Prevotellaceae bacterium]|nr:hypothetical protein [Prevotellaceae bacterium]MDY3365305.1 hypothetical protein [Prevotella sp.]
MKRTVIALICFLPLSVWALSKDSLKAVTMVAYEQSWSDSEGTIALQNNTQEVIRQVKFRLTYLDMNNRQLDYETFSVNVEVEPGMTKKVNIAAYERERHYHYYKTPNRLDQPRFKVNYELKDYNWYKRETKDEDVSISDNGMVHKKKALSSFEEPSLYESPIRIFFMLAVLAFVFSFFYLVGKMARNRGRNVPAWVILSFFVTPFWAIILLLLIGHSHDYYRNDPF